MLKLVVCIKQVPMVSELPWDPNTRTLKRNLAEGMMNPACGHALEAALQIKKQHGGHIVAITMGPPMAEEVLYEAIAMGADRGVLLTDRSMAGGDTSATSYTLARAIKKECPDFDLVLCGCYTSDSETAQVGPQLAEELDVPGAAYIEHIAVKDGAFRLHRVTDNFLEVLEMDMPGLVTVTTHTYMPRYPSLEGLQSAFARSDIKILNARDLRLDPAKIGVNGSPTKIINVYSPTAAKKNIVMQGTAKKVVDEIFAKFADRISGAIGKDLKTHYHDNKACTK
ncbi:MAG: electron transfer flavoprotein subunit beta/FixA family protein [Desulfobacterales bacterium]|nr:MAG: electron transfer flavoprotein subunit beta/FixA family protein [Desulfobacterales bacterium]